MAEDLCGSAKGHLGRKGHSESESTSHGCQGCDFTSVLLLLLVPVGVDSLHYETS